MLASKTTRIRDELVARLSITSKMDRKLATFTKATELSEKVSAFHNCFFLIVILQDMLSHLPDDCLGEILKYFDRFESQSTHFFLLHSVVP